MTFSRRKQPRQTRASHEGRVSPAGSHGRATKAEKPAPRLLLLLLSAFLASASWACGGAQDAEPGSAVDAPAAEPFTLRDSAGVRIAESAAPAWTAESAWTVELTPTLEIGSRAGAGPGEALGRVNAAVRFSDGRIAVADQQATEVLVFGADGTFLERWGGRGQGPGEFQRLDKLAVIAGDSLVVRNDGTFRHEIFGPDGRFGRTVRAPPPSWRASAGQVAGWLPDGSFLVRPPDVQSAGTLPGRQRVDGEWHHFDAAGAYLGVAATLPERLVEGQGTPVRPTVVSYGPWARAATGSTGLWHGYPAAFELRHVGPTGVDRIVRRAWTAEPVSGALSDAYRAWFAVPRLYTEVDEAMLIEYVWLRRTAAELTSRGGSAPPLAFSDSLPAFLGLVVSRDDHLWVEEHATAAELLAGGPDRVGTGRWSVFDPEGRWLGAVILPEGLRVTEIGPDYVLGVWLDALDVSFVRLHRIMKP